MNKQITAGHLEVGMNIENPIPGYEDTITIDAVAILPGESAEEGEIQFCCQNGCNSLPADSIVTIKIQ